MGRVFEGPAIGRHKDVGDELGLFHVSHEARAVNLSYVHNLLQPSD